MKWDLLSLIGMLQNLASGIVSGIGVPGSSPSNFVSPLRATANVIIHFPDRLKPTLVNTQELSGGCSQSPHWGKSLFLDQNESLPWLQRMQWGISSSSSMSAKKQSEKGSAQPIQPEFLHIPPKPH